MANYARVASSGVQINAEMMEGGGGHAFGFKNRDRATIIADILNSLVNNPRGKKKTNIRQSANLSSYMSDKYLDFLLRNDFIKIEEGGIYKPTTKGLRLLQNIDVHYLKMAFTL